MSLRLGFMGDTVKRYQRKDKNQAKIDSAMAAFAVKIDQWLESGPTGKLVLSAEINANQGGVGEICLEQKERQKI